MANTIQLRRSATANAVPTTTQLQLGELAINTYDGKLYLKKNVSGTESIVQIGSNADQLGGFVRDRFVYGDNTTGSINSFTGDGGVGANSLSRSCFYRDNSGQFGALGVHIQHPQNNAYALQIASSAYENGPLRYRVENNGTWSSPFTILDSANYNSYSPTLTGTGASGTWGISISGSAPTLTTARTLTIGSMGKTFNGSANVAWSLAEIGAAATEHKYHSFAAGQYFYDNYEQGNYFRLFTQNATYSTTRYRTISNVEYWDFTTSAWVAWTGGEAGIRNLLDGRQDTSMAVAHANRRFRFVVSQSTSWPTLALYYLQSTWSPIAYTSATVTLESSTTVNGTYTTRDTAVFGSATTGGNYGMHARTTSALHTGDGFLRVTIDITDWVDSGGSTTYPLQNFEVLSNFSGSALEPFSWDYYRNLTVPGSLTATTLNGTISSSQVTSGLGYTPAQKSLSNFGTGAANYSLAATDVRNLTNPTTGLGYAGGGRFRFSSLNDDSSTPYADVIDLSTYTDSSGGGFNSLYFGKNSQLIIHKYAAAAGTSWTSKTLAYTDGATLTNLTLTSYSESKVTNATTTGTVTLDLSTSNVFHNTLTGNTTFAFSNPPANTKVFSFTIITVQDATGGRTITWPASKKFAGGVTPPPTTAANAVDVWSVMTYDGGASYIVSLSVKDAK